MLVINWESVLPSSVPQVKLHCSGEGKFRGVAVSESRGNALQSVESGSDSLTVLGYGEAGELRHLLRQEFPFQTHTICTGAGSLTLNVTHS